MSTNMWCLVGFWMSHTHTHTHRAIKMNKILPFATTWIDLEIIILSEVRERQISYAITYM